MKTKTPSRGSTRLFLLYGAALIHDDLPLDKRIAILAKHLTPTPYIELHVDETIAKAYGAKDKNLGRIYGEIQVSPPKGSCFTITMTPDRSDEVVCKKTVLHWKLQDLNLKTGNLNWIIRTGENDFGTPVTWKTPYRVAKIISSKYDFDEINSSAAFIRSCTAIPRDTPNSSGRRINLSFFNGENWIIRFPEKDESLPPWVPPPPPPPPEDPKKKKDPHGDPHAEKKDEGGHGEAAKEEVKPTPTPKPILEPWTLSTRRGFGMPANLVLTGRAGTSAKNGTCRYQYDSVIGNFESGAIECHYGDGYTYFFAPLTCMKFLQK